MSGESRGESRDEYEVAAEAVKHTTSELSTLAIRAAEQLQHARTEILRLTIENTRLGNLLAVKTTEYEALLKRYHGRGLRLREMAQRAGVDAQALLALLEGENHG